MFRRCPKAFHNNYNCINHIQNLSIYTECINLYRIQNVSIYTEFESYFQSIKHKITNLPETQIWYLKTKLRNVY